MPCLSLYNEIMNRLCQASDLGESYLAIQHISRGIYINLVWSKEYNIRVCGLDCHSQRRTKHLESACGRWPALITSRNLDTQEG